MADQDFGATAISIDEDNNAADHGIWMHLSDSAGNAVAVTGNALDVNIASGAVITEYVEDAVAPVAATGQANLAERIDTPAAITPAVGDWTKLYASVNGALWVSVDGTVAATQSGVWDIGTVTTLTGITNDVNIADGGNSITVDAIDLDIRALDHITIGDSVRIGDGVETMAVNADGSINVNIVQGALSDEFHTADIGTPIALATATQTKTATGGTMLVTAVTVAGSGGVKFVVKNNAVEVMTGFLEGRDGDTKVIPFNPPVEVLITNALTIERTNRQNQPVDVYSSVFGRQL